MNMNRINRLITGIWRPFQRNHHSYVHSCLDVFVCVYSYFCVILTGLNGEQEFMCADVKSGPTNPATGSRNGEQKHNNIEKNKELLSQKNNLFFTDGRYASAIEKKTDRSPSWVFKVIPDEDNNDITSQELDVSNMVSSDLNMAKKKKNMHLRRKHLKQKVFDNIDTSGLMSATTTEKSPSSKADNRFGINLSNENYFRPRNIGRKKIQRFNHLGEIYPRKFSKAKEIDMKAILVESEEKFLKNNFADNRKNANRRLGPFAKSVNDIMFGKNSQREVIPIYKPKKRVIKKSQREVIPIYKPKTKSIKRAFITKKNKKLTVSKKIEPKQLQSQKQRTVTTKSRNKNKSSLQRAKEELARTLSMLRQLENLKTGDLFSNDYDSNNYESDHDDTADSDYYNNLEDYNTVKKSGPVSNEFYSYDYVPGGDDSSETKDNYKSEKQQSTNFDTDKLPTYNYQAQTQYERTLDNNQQQATTNHVNPPEIIQNNKDISVGSIEISGTLDRLRESDIEASFDLPDESTYANENKYKHPAEILENSDSSNDYKDYADDSFNTYQKSGFRAVNNKQYLNNNQNNIHTQNQLTNQQSQVPGFSAFELLMLQQLVKDYPKHLSNTQSQQTNNQNTLQYDSQFQKHNGNAIPANMQSVAVNRHINTRLQLIPSQTQLHGQNKPTYSSSSAHTQNTQQPHVNQNRQIIQERNALSNFPPPLYNNNQQKIDLNFQEKNQYDSNRFENNQKVFPNFQDEFPDQQNLYGDFQQYGGDGPGVFIDLSQPFLNTNTGLIEVAQGTYVNPGMFFNPNLFPLSNSQPAGIVNNMHERPVINTALNNENRLTGDKYFEQGYSNEMYPRKPIEVDPVRRLENSFANSLYSNSVKTGVSSNQQQINSNIQMGTQLNQLPVPNTNPSFHTSNRQIQGNNEFTRKPMTLQRVTDSPLYVGHNVLPETYPKIVNNGVQTNVAITPNLQTSSAFNVLKNTVNAQQVSHGLNNQVYNTKAMFQNNIKPTGRFNMPSFANQIVRNIPSFAPPIGLQPQNRFAKRKPENFRRNNFVKRRPSLKLKGKNNKARIGLRKGKVARKLQRRKIVQPYIVKHEYEAENDPEQEWLDSEYVDDEDGNYPEGPMVSFNRDGDLETMEGEEAVGIKPRFRRFRNLRSHKRPTRPSKYRKSSNRLNKRVRRQRF